MKLAIDRRTAMSSVFAASTLAACPRLFAIEDASTADIGTIAKYVHPKVSWSYAELNEFLEVMPDTGLVSIQKALQLIPEDVATETIEDRSATLNQIQTQILWYSSNVVTFPFRNQEKIGYHNLAKWVGSELDVDQWILDTQPTLVVERAIQEKLFVDIWDKMTPDQRREVLSKIDADGYLKNHAAIAALSGGGALAALSMTVQLTGFAFYATMSTVICTVAGFFGVTLPFAAYTGAASTVAFLTGPVGWTLLAIAAGAGVTMAGRANPRKTAAAICQIHALKVAALEAARQTDGSVFEAMGDPVKRQLVGRWRINGKRETIDVSFESDGKFTADCFDVPGIDTEERKLIWQGKGDWSVRDKSLSVKRTHVWSRVYWSENAREIYNGRPVLDITPTKIILAKDAALARL